MKTLVLSLLAIPLLACGSSGGNSSEENEKSDCAVTWSGAVNGTTKCGVTTIAWGSSNNVGSFSFTVPSTGDIPNIGVVVKWTGPPVAGQTYTATDPNSAESGITLYDSTNTIGWGVYIGGTGPASSPPAAYALMFTSVGAALDTGTGAKLYTAGGTVDGTLVPITGQGGQNVTIHATF